MHFSIPFPDNEIDRLKSLLSYEILDTLPEEDLDKITQLASYICQTPISLITLIDKERQWFKSKTGLDLPELSRNLSFCQQTILQNSLYEVPNLLEEPRFNDNPLIYGDGDLRFYAGYPLRSPEGFNIGTICVLDRVPRQLTAQQKTALETLGKTVISLFELRKKNNHLQSEINDLVALQIEQKEIDLRAYKYALDEAAIVFITNPGGIITYVNDKQCMVSKYSREELVGSDAGILNSGYHTKEFIRNMWQTIQQGRTWKGEFHNRAKDGNLYWVETTIIPFTDREKKIYQYVAIRQDVTERKAREDKLRVYEDIVKNMSSGIYVFKLDEGEGVPDFTLIASNLSAFKFTGINGNRMLGRKLSEILPNLAGTEIPEKFKTVALGSDPIFVGEFQYNSESYKEEYFALNAFSLANNCIGVSFDNITERKQVEVELKKATVIAEQSVIAKDNFLANMSHEIRTPMNAIIGFTDILINTPLSAAQRESVLSVKSAGENLLEIINDILDFSKIESGKMTIENRPFQLQDTLRKIIDLLKLKASEKNILLKFLPEANLPEYISGDKVRLNQIIVNLVGNAIKFTNEGSVTVTVKCIKDLGDQCTISFCVKDTGIGIAADKLEDIFERFTQASNSTTRKFGGTGLGLSIVKNLVELQHGKIDVESVLGEGTSFNFQITYPKVDPDKIQNKEKPAQPATGRKALDILLFEDNPLNQKLAKLVLKGFGYDITIAENGKVGVDLLKDKSYDLILMDLQMPEMDGYQATKAIREELKLATPIMAMTAHSLLGEKEKCLGAGMNEYITKPFKQEELFAKINQLVKTSKETSTGTFIEPLDLSYLKELCENEAAFEKEMLELFLVQVPTDVRILLDATEDMELSIIKAQVHKLRSSLAVVGLHKVIEILSFIEEEAIPKNQTAFIKADIEKIIDRLETCYDQVRKLLQSDYRH